MTDVIEAYILEFPDSIQDKLFQLKAVIDEIIPDATKRIAWNMPTYTIGTINIIHFSVQKHFISLHVGISAVDFFREALTKFSTTKSTIHLPFDDEIPVQLITKIVQYNLLDLYSA